MAALAALVGLLLGVHITSGAGTCGLTDWQCADGSCIDGSLHCDGIKDCPDASDENTTFCSSAPLVVLQPSVPVEVRVQYNATEHAGLDFVLCNSTSCDRLTTFGNARWCHYEGCNTSGGNCTSDFNCYEDGPLPSGLLVLAVQSDRNSFEVMDVKSRLSLGYLLTAFNELTVRPHHRTTDMPVEFGPSKDCAGEFGEQWQCAQGKCIDFRYRCDGNADCPDGSDEDLQCDGLAVPLSVGEVLEVHVQYQQQHEEIWLELQNLTDNVDYKGSKLDVSGLNADGELSYTVGNDCAFTIEACSAFTHTRAEGAHELPSGTIVFLLERLSSEVRVWLPGHADKAASVAMVNADRLRVRPRMWCTDMPVEFRGVAGCGALGWQCGDGSCIDGIYRCDGLTHCQDASDEDPAVCSRAPSVSLRFQYPVEVRVQYNATVHVGVDFVLCDGASCQKYTTTSTDWQWNDCRCENCNSLGGNCTSCQGCYLGPYAGQAPLPWQAPLPSGQLVFVVEWDGLAYISMTTPTLGLTANVPGAVWPKGSVRSARWTPYYERDLVLKVIPRRWTSDMPVEFGPSKECLLNPGSYGWQCSDGRCMYPNVRCDGTDDCPDGSSKPYACDNVTFSPLSVGGVVEVHVQYDEEVHFGVLFNFWDNAHALFGKLLVVGSCGGQLIYEALVPDNDSEFLPGPPCPPETGNVTFSTGEVVFLLERLSSEVRVWLPGYADKAANVTMSAVDNLSVLPFMGETDMPVEFRVLPSPATTSTPPSSSTASPWPPSPAPTACSPEWESLLIPAPQHCDRYVVCYSGRTQDMPCPPGLRFNYEQQTCDWPRNVRCDA